MKKSQIALILLFGLLIAIVSCSGEASSTNEAASKDVVKKDTLEYLVHELKFNKNEDGGITCHGTIMNKSNDFYFANSVIEFEFYSESGELLGKEEKMWDKVIAPGSVLNFLTKYKEYSEVVDVQSKLIDAEVVK